MSTEPPLYRGHRFPGEIVSQAVWLYHLFSLSLRDIELISPNVVWWSPTRASALGPQVRR